MEYNEVKKNLTECPHFKGLEPHAAADLFWRGEEKTLAEGELIYAEGEKLDYTFCLLLSGDLIVEKGGSIIGGILEQQIFGEMAYFTNQRARTANVRVGSQQAVVLKFRLMPEELASPGFASLRKCLELHTWNRFVSTSQFASDSEELVMAH